MLRQAAEADAPAIDAFLAPMTDTSLFLRGNLARHGLSDNSHPHGTAYFLWEDRGAIRAVFGCSNGGYLMCQAPDAPPGFWSALPAALSGRRVTGMTGLTEQVGRTLDALGLRAHHFTLDHHAPILALDLRALPVTPEPAIRAATSDDLPLLESWFRGYIADTEPDRPARQVAEEALTAAHRAVHTADTRLLIEDDTPRAMAAVLSRAGDTVQVGTVYVPPEHRDAGRAGTVVAAHLADLRDRSGVTSAVLFAHNAAAARAYERIGFRHIATARIVKLATPQEIAPCP